MERERRDEGVGVVERDLGDERPGIGRAQKK
jgi:hypothetical protein